MNRTRFLGFRGCLVSIAAVLLLGGTVDASPPADSDEGVIPGRSVKLPVLLKKIEPIYPETARAERREGKVILRATVGIDGKVRDPEVLSSTGGEEFEEAAKSAVLQWEYEPATQDGQPVPIQYTIRVDFRLREGGENTPGLSPPI